VFIDRSLNIIYYIWSLQWNLTYHWFASVNWSPKSGCHTCQLDCKYHSIVPIIRVCLIVVLFMLSLAPRLWLCRRLQTRKQTNFFQRASIR